MISIAIASLLIVVVIVFILGVRDKDLPEPEPVSPFAYLDERKAAIYESLRDLQFEFRVGKLSDADYQTTKKDLQKELAVVMQEVDKLRESLGMSAAAPAPAAEPPRRRENKCPSCGASFEKALKFCGECGKPMGVSA